MYGSDSRYTKSLGLLDDTTDYITQPDFPEVSVSIHIPIPGTKGLDVIGGKYEDQMSAETLDSRKNNFYSHSYIFNFGVPESDTGGLATLHINECLDVYAGINRGVNTSLADNNASIAFEGGIGLNLFHENLKTLALTHVGPENPGNNHDYRYLNDITTTWKINKCLTSITDMNLIADSIDGGKWGGGFAQYFTYCLNDWLKLGFRGEIFRDSGGFYVAEFRANNDFVHIELQGRAVPFDPSNLGGGDTTYLEVTGGVTINCYTAEAVRQFANPPGGSLRPSTDDPVQAIRAEHEPQSVDDRFGCRAWILVNFQNYNRALRGQRLHLRKSPRLAAGECCAPQHKDAVSGLSGLQGVTKEVVGIRACRRLAFCLRYSGCYNLRQQH